MPQDKRLIITKAVVHKLQRVCHNDTDEASQEGVYIAFVVPSVVLQQVPELVSSRTFHLPHKTFRMNGRTTCLIVPNAIAHDCIKINKRHGYYDAVITAEAICKRGDAEAMKRAAKVANTFHCFVVDTRIVGRLPTCITEVVTASTKQASSAATCPTRCLTTLEGLEERTSLSFRLSQGAVGSKLVNQRQGQILLRVGHGGMTAGEICENAKNFIFTLKKDYPTVWKYVNEFKMVSNKTESIRFMETQIQR